MTSIGPRYASREDVEDLAAGMKFEFLLCRDMMHAWQPHDRSIGSDGVIKRTLMCHRCKTQRVQEITMRGGLLSSHYIYPDGYQAKGLGRVAGDAKDAFRIASIMRDGNLVGVRTPANGRVKRGRKAS